MLFRNLMEFRFQSFDWNITVVLASLCSAELSEERLALPQQGDNQRDPYWAKKRQVNRNLMFVREIDLANHRLIKESLFAIKVC